MAVIESGLGEIEQAEYFAQGEAAAMALPNRGPLRFHRDGRVHEEILEAYSQYGFYVFENVIGPEELAEARSEVEDLLGKAPFPNRASEVDRLGRPAFGRDLAVNPWLMAPPLSDPVGGTSLNNGRHPVKMHEPEPVGGAPAEVPYLVFGTLQLLDTALRIYGHPGLLRVAEAINGPDFTPFTDVLFVKEPGLGPSVAWHQDGQIHWENPKLDGDTHGFNFQVQLYGSTPGNGVWVVPGSHQWGKIDIQGIVDDNGGSSRLPGAVPLVCRPGDAFITNRQTLHGSFPNTSSERRVTVNFGFHRYSSVVDQTGALTRNGVVYDREYVRQRSRCIPVAIDARAQRFPHEERYVYEPFVGEEDENRFNEETRVSVLQDYNVRDIAI